MKTIALESLTEDQLAPQVRTWGLTLTRMSAANGRLYLLDGKLVFTSDDPAPLLAKGALRVTWQGDGGFAKARLASDDPHRCF